MKKATKITTAAALAMSALTPVAAFASEATLANGYYGETFTSMDTFKAMTSSAKKSFLIANMQKANFVLVSGGKVYNLSGTQGEKLLNTTTDAEAAQYATTQAAYQAATGVTISATGITTTTPVTGELKVESVSAINGKQIQVTFNQAVEASSVINSTTPTTPVLQLGVVTLTRTTTTAHAGTDFVLATAHAALSADGKTLTLTETVSAGYLVGAYSVTVKDVKDKATGKAVTTEAKIINVKDEILPTVTSLTYEVDKGGFVIKFSEPLSTSPSTLRINGEVVSGTLSSNNTVLTVAKPATVAAGTQATVYVAGAKDGASNLSAPYTGTVAVTADSSAVSIASTTVVGPNKIRVVFNKPIATTDANIKAALTVLKESAAYAAAGVAVAKNTTVDSTGKTYDITLGTSTTGPLFGDIYTATTSTANIVLAFAADSILDHSGNKLAATSQTVTLNKDVTSPKVVSTKLSTDGKYLEVKFDKEISAFDATKIAIRKNGAEVLSSVSAAVSGVYGATAIDTTDKTILKVYPAVALAPSTTTGALTAGTYTVRLTADAVTSVNGPKSAAATLSDVTVGATGNPTATITNNSSANNKFKIVFSESVTAATALNAANYKLDGVALPSTVDIRFDGTDATNKTVLIDLLDGSVNIGSSSAAANAALSVESVQAVSGKTVVSKYDTVTVQDNTSATLLSSELVAPTVLKLTFDEVISATTFALADIQLKSDAGTFVLASISPTTATAVASGKSIIVTFTPAATGETPSFSTVINGANLKASTVDGSTVDGKTDAMTDVNGFKTKAGVTVNVTK